MDTSRLDLLPSERRRSLRRGYFLRLATVVAIAAAVLAVAASALLTPTYTYLLSAERSAKQRLTDEEANLSSAQETELGKRFASLEADAAVVASLATTTLASVVIKDALAVPHAGVVLSDFQYAPAAGARSGTLALSGVAATRNDLRAFQLALAEAPAFTDANLPVSSYAKDQDLPFTITVTLATSTSPKASISTAP